MDTRYTKHTVEQEIGKTMTFSKTFTGANSFGAVHAAEEWLTEHGYSYGVMCSPAPIGIAKNAGYISKWYNLGTDTHKLDGAIVSADFRDGPVTVYLDYAPQGLTHQSGAEHAAATTPRRSRETPTKSAKETYLSYLKGTLIPDLRKSRCTSTVEDFVDLVHVIKHPTGKAPHYGRSASDFVNYLEETLIPDLRDSGSDATAEDFEAGIAYWRSSRYERAKRAVLKKHRGRS
jgi:hypothetical protein